MRVITSPVGELTLIASDAGLQAILWPPVDRDAPTESSAADRILDLAVTQLEEYFAGTRTEFDVPLDPQGTPFQLAAWEALRTIPFGQTVSYGHQARLLGDVGKARAVGAANGRNPLSIIVPCHRVVGSNGKLVGFGGGLSAKAWLLDHEKRVLARS
jgi:methylated-DNA-[protein]-cysteine S-methyltransferase